MDIDQRGGEHRPGLGVSRLQYRADAVDLDARQAGGGQVARRYAGEFIDGGTDSSARGDADDVIGPHDLPGPGHNDGAAVVGKHDDRRLIGCPFVGYCVGHGHAGELRGQPRAQQRRGGGLYTHQAPLPVAE